MSPHAGPMPPPRALAVIVLGLALAGAPGAQGLGLAWPALPLAFPAPLQCLGLGPVFPDCVVDDAAPGDVVEFTKVGRIPVDILSSVRGKIGDCEPDTFLCGRYAVEAEGEVLWAHALSGPVLVVGHDPLL